MINPFRRKNLFAQEESQEKKASSTTHDYTLESLEPRLLLAADLGVGLDIRGELDGNAQPLSIVSSVFEDSAARIGTGAIGFGLQAPIIPLDKSVSFSDSPNTITGTAMLQLGVDDLGNTGTGGKLTDSETVTIFVSNNSSPVLSTIGNQTVDELATLNLIASATDSDLPADSLTYSLDAASLALGMTIDANTGAYSWAPTESQGGMTPTVAITVTDSGIGNRTDTETFIVTVNDINLAPTIDSDGSGAQASIDIEENQTTVTTVTASDGDVGDTIEYSIIGGTDAARFVIDESSGELAFITAPDFEAPSDLGTDNVYDIIVQADDGNGGTDSQNISVTVSNVSPVAITVSGGNGAIVNANYTLNLSADEDVTSWTINWGDGTVETVSGNLTSVNHIYRLEGMTFDISVSATDASGTIQQNQVLIADYDDDHISRYDPVSGTIIDTYGAVTNANHVVVGPDGLLYVSSYTSGEILRFDSQTGVLVDTFVADALVPSSFGFGPDGNLYVSSIVGSGVYRYDGATGVLIDEFINVLNPQGFVFGEDGNLYLTASFQGILRYDATTGVFIDSFTSVITSAKEIVIGPDGNLYVTSLSGDKVVHFDGSTGVALGDFVSAGSGGLDGASNLKFGPDGNLYVSSENTGEILRYDRITGAFIDSYATVTHPIGLVFLPQHQVEVLPTNDAPVLDPIGSQSVDEGATLTIVATATDVDVPADTLTYSLDAASVALGMSIDASSGEFSWTPGESQGPSTVFATITVTDSGSNDLSDSETFIINVDEINSAPVLAAIGDQTVNEGVELSFTVNATDSDLPLNSLTFSLDAASIALGMSINASSGLFAWTPNESQGGLSPSVIITVSDSSSGTLTDSETITIAVNDQNTAPVLAPIGDQNINEGATLSFIATASDPDLPSDTLTYSLDAASIALGMTIDANTGVFSWMPTEDQGSLTPSVTITVTDSGSGTLTDSEAITIAVNDQNTAPVLSLIGDQNIDEGATLSFIATASDADRPSDTLTYSLDAASIALGMTIDANTGVFSWTPAEDQGSLTPSVTITVTDSGSGTLADSETITIAVNDQNTAPVLASIGDQNINEGATLSFIATASDADLPSDTLTYSLDAASIALGMTIDANTGVFSWTPTEDQGDLTPSVTITVTDSGSGTLTDSETITIAVNELNTAPVLAAIGDQNIDEGATLSFIATASDADRPSDTLTYSLDAASIALGMTIDANTGVFSWTPTEDQGDLTPSVTITVTDSGSGTLTDSETITIAVNELNTAPVLAAIGDQNIDEGATLSFIATASDADRPSDTLTYSLDAASIALGMTIDANTGVFSWTPAEDQGSLTPSVTITVTDSGSGTLADSETITIAVNDQNTAPVLSLIGDQNIDEGATLSFIATASDADRPSDTLTYSLDAASIALGMTIDANTGVFSWTPAEDQGSLTPSVTITVTDSGSGTLTDSEAITIAVNDQNTAPVLSLIGDQNINEGATLSFIATASDADRPSDTLTYSLDAASIALGMTIDANTGVFSWTPAEDQGSLTPSVTITVTDSGSGTLTDSEAITIAVNDQNTAPVLASIGDQNINEGATLSFIATASDADRPSDTLTYSLDAASIALGMTIDDNTGVFSWTPAEDQGDLTPSVTITVTDSGSGNLVDSQEIKITVLSVNTRPIINTIADQYVDEGKTLTISAIASDTDLPATGLTYSLDGDSIALGMTIDENSGVVTWTPTEMQGGLSTIVTISVADLENLTDSVQFAVFVKDNNAAPVITSGGAGVSTNISVVENQTFVTQILATDADYPVDELVYSISGGADQDLFQLNASGELVFAIAADYSSLSDADGDGIYEVEVQVSDGLVADNQLIRVIILEAGELPVGSAVLAEGEGFSIEAPASNTNVVPINMLQPENGHSSDNDEESPSQNGGGPNSSYPEQYDDAILLVEEPVFIKPKLQKVGHSYIQLDDDSRREIVANSPIKILLNNTLIMNSFNFAMGSDLQFADDIQFDQSLDDLRSTLTNDSVRVEAVVRSSALFASGFSIGYIAWLAKGGLMATSLVSSMPMWRVLDPIPVLASMDGGDEDGNDDDQSLASMIETKSQTDLAPSDVKNEKIQLLNNTGRNT